MADATSLSPAVTPKVCSNRDAQAANSRAAPPSPKRRRCSQTRTSSAVRRAGGDDSDWQSRSVADDPGAKFKELRRLLVPDLGGEQFGLLPPRGDDGLLLPLPPLERHTLKLVLEALQRLPREGSSRARRAAVRAIRRTVEASPEGATAFVELGGLQVFKPWLTVPSWGHEQQHRQHHHQRHLGLQPGDVRVVLESLSVLRKLPVTVSAVVNSGVLPVLKKLRKALSSARALVEEVLVSWHQLIWVVGGARKAVTVTDRSRAGHFGRAGRCSRSGRHGRAGGSRSRSGRSGAAAEVSAASSRAADASSETESSFSVSSPGSSSTSSAPAVVLASASVSASPGGLSSSPFSFSVSAAPGGSRRPLKEGGARASFRPSSPRSSSSRSSSPRSSSSRSSSLSGARLPAAPATFLHPHFAASALSLQPLRPPAPRAKTALLPRAAAASSPASFAQQLARPSSPAPLVPPLLAPFVASCSTASPSSSRGPVHCQPAELTGRLWSPPRTWSDPAAARQHSQHEAEVQGLLREINLLGELLKSRQRRSDRRQWLQQQQQQQQQQPAAYRIMMVAEAATPAPAEASPAAASAPSALASAASSPTARDDLPLMWIDLR